MGEVVFDAHPGLPLDLIVQEQRCYLLRLLAGHLPSKTVLAKVDALAGLLAVTVLVPYREFGSRRLENPPFDFASPAHAVSALLASQPGAVSTRLGSATVSLRQQPCLRSGLEVL